MNIKYCFCIIACVLFISCSEQDMTVFFADSYLYSLEASNTNVETDPLKKELSVQITSNVSWEAKTTDSWITINNSSGLGTDKLLFNVTANLNKEDRIGYIKIYHNGYFKKDLKIIQKASTLSTDSDILTIGPQGGVVNLKVICSGEWRIENSCDWITTSLTKGLKDSYISITINKHPSTKERFSSIIITDQAGNKREIVMAQNGCQLELKEKEVFLLKSGKQKIIEFTSNWELEIIGTENTWLKTSISNNKITFESDDNLSGNRRWMETFVRFKDFNNNIDTLFVNQGCYEEPQICEIWEKYGSGIIMGGEKYAISNLGGDGTPESLGRSFTYDGVYSEEELNAIKELKSQIIPNRYNVAKLLIGEGWTIPTSMLFYQREFYYEQINGIDCVGFGNFDGHIVYLPYGSYWSNEFYKANVVEAGTLGPYFRSYSFYNNTPLRIRVCPDN